jgi:hypothetical protein
LAFPEVAGDSTEYVGDPSAFPEVRPKEKRKQTAARTDSSLAFPEAKDVAPAGGGAATTGGFFESLPGVPEQLARLLISGANPTFGYQNIGEHVADIARAESGDQEAANRARAYETALIAASSLIPGGPEVELAAGPIALARTLAARSALGAVGGAVPAAAEAAAKGEPILPAAESGALLGGVLGPAAGIAGPLLKLRAAQRLAKTGRDVPAKLAAEAAAEVEAATKAASGTPELDPVKRVVQALKEVPDLRTEQEKLFRTERGKRIAEFGKRGAEGFGEAGARTAMGALKGELPKVSFGSLRPLVEQGDIDQLFQMVKASPVIGDWERVHATQALLGLFQSEGFKLPQRAELAVLEKVFGSDLVETLLSKQDNVSVLKRLGRELVNAPRALTASFDLSAPLRQGLFIGAGHPKAFASACGQMFKYWKSPEAIRDLEVQMASDPVYELAHRAGLAITRPGSVLGQQEERFAGTLVQKIPGISASERAYTGFLNKIRFDVFKSMVKDSQNAGIELGDRELKQIGAFVNAASGRGNLPKSLANHAETLNAVLFSPRLLASRLYLLNPVNYVNASPVVRQHAIRSLLSLGALATTALAIAKASGADVETDMTSPDWGKIRVGDTRYDIGGGFTQYLRTGARMAQALREGEGISEKVTGAAKPTLPFLRNKLAPVPSLVADLWKGTDFAGQPLKLDQALMSRFTPLILQDTFNAVQSMGWQGIPATLPSVFGVGVSTYQ